MPTRLAGAAALAITAATPALAAEKPVYIGAGAAVQTIHAGDDGIAGLFRFGAKLDEALPGFGLEGEITRSLVDPERGNGNGVTYTTFGGYAVYTAPLPDRRVSLRGRLGTTWVDADRERGDGDSEMEISWGFGAEYRVSSEASVFADYTRMAPSLGHLNLGVQANF
jgi:hypothetical protein